jgi:hypothetical protein
MVLPEPVHNRDGLILIGTTTGNVPATAYKTGGMAIHANGSLYVVFL